MAMSHLIRGKAKRNEFAKKAARIAELIGMPNGLKKFLDVGKRIRRVDTRSNAQSQERRHSSQVSLSQIRFLLMNEQSNEQNLSFGIDLETAS